jgi:hypothetical protein
MYDVVIFFEENIHQLLITETFEGTDFRIKPFNSIDQVIKHCELNHVDLIIFWAPDISAFSRLSQVLVDKQLTYLPVVAMMDNDALLEKFSEYNIADVIKLPVHREILNIRLIRILEDCGLISTDLTGMNWEGSIEEYKLLDLIPLFEKNERDAVLELSLGDYHGEVIFFKGKVIDAKFRQMSGLSALEKLALIPSGYFKSTSIKHTDVSDSISMSNESLLTHLLNHKLEIDDICNHLPGYEEKLRTNPFVIFENPTPLQRKITDLCIKPHSILDIALKLDAPNIEIFTAIDELFKAAKLDYQHKVEKLIIEEQERSGLDKILSSLKDIFKKKDADEVKLPDFHFEENVNQPEQISLTIPKPYLEDNDLETLQRKLQEILK